MDMSGGARGARHHAGAGAPGLSPAAWWASFPPRRTCPSGTAVKPGDILRAMSGKTVEVINTDAEGRLILADALSYAVEKYQPACIIDLATLTGARGGRPGGTRPPAMMGTDDDMMTRPPPLREAGEHCAERVWQLPPVRRVQQADQERLRRTSKNTGGGRDAGSIIGGVFLKEFVGDTPWVHLDIAGMAWTREAKPYVPKGSTGWGIRLLVETLESLPAPAAKARGRAKGKTS